MKTASTPNRFSRDSVVLSVRDALARRLHLDLLATPVGRAHVLRQLATAESADEATIFEEVRKYCKDPEIEKLVKKHAEDETRHAQLFEECVTRQGVDDPGAVAEELQVLKVLDKTLEKTEGRGFLASELGGGDTRESVAKAYLLLQVVEERALHQFRQMAPVFAKYDAATAEVLASVIADEERHLKYCYAIVARYAPNEAWAALHLQRFRDAEALAFRDVQQANLTALLARDLLPATTARFFGIVSKLLRNSKMLPYTPTGLAGRPSTRKAA